MPPAANPESGPASRTQGESANGAAAASVATGPLPNGTAALHGSAAETGSEDFPVNAGTGKEGVLPLKGGRLANAVVSETGMPNGVTPLENGTAESSPLANGSVKPGKEVAAALHSNGHVTGSGAAGAHAADIEL